LLDQLTPYDEALEATRAELRQIARAGSSVRTLRVRQLLHRLVHAVRDAVTQVLVQSTPTPASVPDVRALLAEFGQLHEEFDDFAVDCRSNMLAVTTEPITLEDVDLGPFRIRLNWDRLVGETGAPSFDLEALEPNPSASNEDVPHPHVSNGGLCAGDGTHAMARALQQGRLADAFLLVRHILTTYNPSSAYVSLDDWSGSECQECGRTVSGEQSWPCQGCLDTFCAECAHDCVVCDTVHCRGCLIECDDCAELHCGRCLASEAHTCNDLDEAVEDAVLPDTVTTIASEPLTGEAEALASVNSTPNPEMTNDTPELITV
jgi:hypothetical protein